MAYVIIALADPTCFASPPEVIKRIPDQTIMKMATIPAKRRNAFATLRNTVGRQLIFGTSLQ